jgi:plastocyanin
VIVYVRSAKVKVHPDLAKPEGEVVLDNKNCRFEPHVLPIQIGQTLLLKNSDPIGHNSNVQPLGDQGVNPLIAAGTDARHKFNRKQTLPVPVSCNIHPWMKAYVLPRDNPYTAVSDADGNFTIKNLPAGEKLEFQVWQEKAGYLEAKSDWKKGRFEMTLKPGENNLGVIKIKPAVFAK